jgi:hypothetical protein
VRTLDLTASTGSDSYQIVGGLDDFQTSTKVCDIMKPFTLTGGGFTNKFSGGLSGTYNFTGPFQSEGSGPTRFHCPRDRVKPGTMTGQGSGPSSADLPAPEPRSTRSRRSSRAATEAHLGFGNSDLGVAALLGYFSRNNNKS